MSGFKKGNCLLRFLSSAEALASQREVTPCGSGEPCHSSFAKEGVSSAPRETLMKLCVNGKPACPARMCAGRVFFRARSTDGCPSLAWTSARTVSSARRASSWRMLSACDREGRLLSPCARERARRQPSTFQSRLDLLLRYQHAPRGRLKKKVPTAGLYQHHSVSLTRQALRPLLMVSYGLLNVCRAPPENEFPPLLAVDLILL